jgi:hypothetical protein
MSQPYFEICNLNFAFCPAEAGKFRKFSKGLNCYEMFITIRRLK